MNSSTILHWSCWLNSDSVMYGGMLIDHGNGTFTDINGPRKYSQLDQYLMGLRQPAEVDPLWYVVVGGSMTGCADPPQPRGVAHDITGERVDFPIDDVIRALGPRNPATSQCHYKLGFVFAHAPGNPPSTSDLEKVEGYRAAIAPWFAGATDQRGSLDTSLDGCGIGTAGCPGAPSPQCQNPPDGGIYDGGATDGGGPVVDAGGGERGFEDAAPAADGGGGATDSGGGCGCRAARGGAASALAGLVLAALALWRRRSRRCRAVTCRGPAAATGARPRDR
jgi:MYXO-CTERM domain-containing protein